MAEPAIHRLRVLLVEDETANRILVRAIIDRARVRDLPSIDLIEAATLATARAVTAEEHVDIVLLDVRLPDGNGLDLATELAGRPLAERPRVIVLSASVLATERTAALETGADAFLAKPFDSGELIALLSRFSTRE